MPEKVNRRQFLATLGAGVAGLIIGFAGGWFSKPPEVKRETVTVTKTVTETVTEAAPPTPKKIKAGWIFVGPIGDYGWTRAHYDGMMYAKERFPWLEIVWRDKVTETDAPKVIRDFVEREKVDIMFTTSFGFMDPTFEAAKDYPDRWFWHCSGYKRRDNMGTYFAEFYQLYYLNGLAAAAVTETRRVGYVAAFLIPEVVRHLNAFFLGVIDGLAVRDGRDPVEYREDPALADVEFYIIRLGAWYNPDGARAAAKTLVETNNCDVLSFTEDTPAVLQQAEEYQMAGKKVWSFSHYSPMKQYGPTAHLTGQIADWGPIYAYILAKFYAGIPESEDIWTRIGDFTPYRWARPVEESTAGTKEGTVYLAELNTDVIPPKFIRLIKQRYEEMKELLFEPFTGPIYDVDGVKRVKEGERLGHDPLWTMNWYVKGVINPPPPEL